MDLTETLSAIETRFSIASLEKRITQLERQHNKLVSFLEGYLGTTKNNTIMDLQGYKVNE